MKTIVLIAAVLCWFTHSITKKEEVARIALLLVLMCIALALGAEVQTNATSASTNDTESLIPPASKTTDTVVVVYTEDSTETDTVE